MIDAFAQAAAVLDEPRYGDAAAKAADFLLDSLCVGGTGVPPVSPESTGKMPVPPERPPIYCGGRGATAGPAALPSDDYASLANALTTLHQQQREQRWLDEAVGLADAILARFADPRGGFFYTPADHEPLIVRKKDLVDNSTPSGNGLAVVVLLRLAEICGRDDYRRRPSPPSACEGVLQQFPAAVGQLLLCVDMSLAAG